MYEEESERERENFGREESDVRLEKVGRGGQNEKGELSIKCMREGREREKEIKRTYTPWKAFIVSNYSIISTSSSRQERITFSGKPDTLKISGLRFECASRSLLQLNFELL